MDQVDLPEVRLGWVSFHSGTVLHRFTEVRVSIDSEPSYQRYRRTGRFRKSVVPALADGHNARGFEKFCH